MVDNSARIRQYEPNDERLVRFVLGKATLEPLTVANRRGTFGTFHYTATPNLIRFNSLCTPCLSQYMGCTV